MIFEPLLAETVVDSKAYVANRVIIHNYTDPGYPQIVEGIGRGIKI
jgi:hypothetical protein